MASLEIRDVERLTFSCGSGVQSHVREKCRARLVEAEHDARLPIGLGAYTITWRDTAHLSILRLRASSNLGHAGVLGRAETEHRQQRLHDGRVEVRAGAAPQLDRRAGRVRAFE